VVTFVGGRRLRQMRFQGWPLDCASDDRGAMVQASTVVRTETTARRVGVAAARKLKWWPA